MMFSFRNLCPGSVGVRRVDPWENHMAIGAPFLPQPGAKIPAFNWSMTMVYVNNILGGFLFAIGFFLAKVLVGALFHTGICG